ncbi:MAG: thiamine pyrophosphate-requiring protein [Gammaproteobacteria bacterium]|nr:thiamine pyrophosphate-requiring protein [Gammaproteobacteria bacterium]
MHAPLPRTAAEAFLLSLSATGIAHFFANPGTDCAPLIEGYAHGAARGWTLPRPIACVHETLAVGMAHGASLVTGEAQAVMLHTNVGLANGVMGLLNAASDQVPMLLLSGRTPIVEQGRDGCRDLGIHWGQEMRDQAALVRESCKWDYDARYGEQLPALVERALAIARSAPQGPVYLALAREVLAEPWPRGVPATVPRIAPAEPARPAAAAIERAAAILAGAERPLIVAQRSGTDRHAWQALLDLAERFALPVAEHWSVRPGFPTTHPMHAGFAPGAALASADAVLVLDAMVPWIPAHTTLAAGCQVIQAGADPLKARIPVRGYPSDLTLAGDIGLILADLAVALAERLAPGDAAVSARRERLAAAHRSAREALFAIARDGGGAPMHPFYATRCINDAFGAQATYVSELALNPALLDLERPGQYFSHALSGGLGWGVPAALGVQLAKPGEAVVACVGDGSHLFANPVAAHQLAEALALPLLICVFDNGAWNTVRAATRAMYPEGAAAGSAAMPLTSLEPAPDYVAIARASRAHAERVVDGRELPAALARARAAMRAGQPALLDLVVRAP